MKIICQLGHKGKVQTECHLVQVELKERRVHFKSSQLSCLKSRGNGKEDGSLQGEQSFWCCSQGFKRKLTT